MLHFPRYSASSTSHLDSKRPIVDKGGAQLVTRGSKSYYTMLNPGNSAVYISTATSHECSSLARNFPCCRSPNAPKIDHIEGAESANCPEWSSYYSQKASQPTRAGNCSARQYELTVVSCALVSLHPGALHRLRYIADAKV